METGKVVEIIGAVIDVQFARDSMPKVFDALKVDESGLTLEVQQQIGDGIVRTIAMGSTMTDAKVIDKVALVYGQMNEPPGNRLRVALTGLTMAEHFRDEGSDTLLFVDNIYQGCISYLISNYKIIIFGTKKNVEKNRYKRR